MSEFLDNLGKIGMVLQAGGGSLAGRDGMAVVRDWEKQQQEEQKRKVVADILAGSGIAGPQRALLEQMPTSDAIPTALEMMAQMEAQRRAGSAAAASAAQEAAERQRREQAFLEATRGGVAPQAGGYSFGERVTDVMPPSQRLSFGTPAPASGIETSRLPPVQGFGPQPLPTPLLAQQGRAAIAGARPAPVPLVSPQEAPPVGLSFGERVNAPPAQPNRFTIYDNAYKQELAKGPFADPVLLESYDRLRQEFAPPEMEATDDIREYQFAVSQGYKGNFSDFMLESRRAGASSVSVDVGGNAPQVGTIPQGYELFQAPEGGWQMRAIPGGPEDTSAKTTKMAGLADTSGETVILAARRAREANKSRVATGALGAVASYNPASNNAEVYRQVATLQSLAASENINAMRAASPTGGALGNASDADILLLKQKSGALDPASPNFERDLADYERTLLETIHGREEGRRIFNETRDVRAPSSSGGSGQDRRTAPPPGPTPPAPAITMLRNDPSPEARADFDEIFGAGAAARVLGQ